MTATNLGSAPPRKPGCQPRAVKVRLTHLVAQGLVPDWTESGRITPCVAPISNGRSPVLRTVPEGVSETCQRQRTLLHCNLMNNGTKWIVGTGVAIITAIVGSAVAVVAVVVTLAGDIRADLRDVRADLRDVRASVDSLDVRLRAVEVGFGKVDQRLLAIERVVLPPSRPGE